MLLIRQVSMSLIYVSFKYVSQPVIIDIDELSECSDGKVVEKKSVESDHDRFKMSKDKGKGGKSRHVHPNADDGNKKTSGAENLTKSGSKVKAATIPIRDRPLIKLKRLFGIFKDLLFQLVTER